MAAPDHLSSIETLTLSHYSDSAAEFWQRTKDHDVSQNYAAFLAACLQGKAAGTTFDILDFGCGPGRDLHYFKSLGHRPTGLDGCADFCAMARDHSDCEVLQQNFLQLQLSPQSFDGIFANATLFHIPSSELPRVLRELHAALRKDGILFTSNPRGNAEGWSGSRYGHWMEFDVCVRFWQEAGFEIADHYYRPAGRPRAEQPWLALVSRKR
jgi:SAM-dependent methyltransferase